MSLMMGGTIGMACPCYICLISRGCNGLACGYYLGKALLPNGNGMLEPCPHGGVAMGCV